MPPPFWNCCSQTQDLSEVDHLVFSSLAQNVADDMSFRHWTRFSYPRTSRAARSDWLKTSVCSSHLFVLATEPEIIGRFPCTLDWDHLRRCLSWCRITPMTDKKKLLKGKSQFRNPLEIIIMSDCPVSRDVCRCQFADQYFEHRVWKNTLFSSHSFIFLYFINGDVI